MVAIRTKNRSFLNLHHKRFKNYLKQDKLSKENLLDAYVSLHIILEVGINNLFDIIAEKYNATYSKEEVQFIHFLNDKVSITDKLKQFIGTHRFPGYIESGSTQYEFDKKVFKKIANFSQARNRIIHGARIEAFEFNEKIDDFSSDARFSLIDQLDEFNKIIESLLRLIKFSDIPYKENIFIDMGLLGLEKIKLESKEENI